MMTDDIESIREEKREERREQVEGSADGDGIPTSPVSIGGAADLQSASEEYEVVLADFYADWCGPCQMLEPVVETIAEETEAAVAKVDVDANQQLASEYGVRGVPTMVLFVDGEPVERVVGMQDESRLRELITSHTGS